MLSKLQRRADDAVETRDGQLALKMRVSHGVDKEGNNFFRFRSSPTLPVTVVTWPGEQLAILEEGIAKYLLRNGYAIGLDDEEIEAFNKAVDSENAETKKAADAKAAADKKAADEKAAAAKKAADEKAAAEKAAAEKASADKKAAEAKSAEKSAD